MDLPTSHGPFNKNSVVPEEIKAKVHRVGEQVGAVASDLVSRTSDYVNEGRDYIKHNPTKGVVMAMMAGVLTGSVLTMALRKR